MKSLNFRHFFTACFLLAALGLASGAEIQSARKSLLSLPQRVVIPKLHGPLVLNGNLNEKVWAQAAILSPFLLNGSAKPAREKTSVRIWYDDSALYLGWTCNDTDIQATLTARDSQLWDEEVVEFFVAPKRLDRYFELQWNPVGGVFDAKIKNKINRSGFSKKIIGDPKFTAKGMSSAVQVRGSVNKSNSKDKMWQVEVAIPFAALNEGTPKPKAIWRANLYRYSRTKGLPLELLSWSPTLMPGFHEPTRFGYLEFGE